MYYRDCKRVVKNIDSIKKHEKQLDQILYNAWEDYGRISRATRWQRLDPSLYSSTVMKLSRGCRITNSHEIKLGCGIANCHEIKLGCRIANCHENKLEARIANSHEIGHACRIPNFPTVMKTILGCKIANCHENRLVCRIAKCHEIFPGV